VLAHIPIRLIRRTGGKNYYSVIDYTAQHWHGNGVPLEKAGGFGFGSIFGYPLDYDVFLTGCEKTWRCARLDTPTGR
jgi:hypothetical protein